MDAFLFHIINNFSGKSIFGDQVFAFCATVLGNVVIALAILFLVFHKENKEWFSSSALAFKKRFFEGVTIFSGGVLAWGITKIIKMIIARPRPFEVLNDAHQLVPETLLESFPSNHATFFMAMAIGILLFHKKPGKLFLALAVIISISRILVGVHYPSDILAGWGIGILSAVFVRYIFLKIFKIEL